MVILDKNHYSRCGALKICHIIYTYDPDVLGGADIYAQRICTSLAEKGHNIVIITTQPYHGLKSIIPSKTRIKNITVYRYYPLNVYSGINSANKPLIFHIIWHIIHLWNLHTYIVIRKILKAEKPDIVHIHTPLWLSFSVFSAVKKEKIPSIFTIHDYLLLCPKILMITSQGSACLKPHVCCSFYRRITRIISADVPAVILGPSNFVLSIFKENKFFLSTPSYRLPLGVDQASQDIIHKNEDTINILFVGGLEEKKGIYILLKAFIGIENKDIRLHIAGKGSEEENIKKCFGMDKRIVFHGYQDGINLENLFRLAHIVVLPSFCLETFGLTILESFHYGVPVIGSNIGAYPELIKDGYNGLLFEPKNVNHLQEILQKVISEPHILKDLQTGAQSTAMQYSQLEHVEKLEQIYRDVIKSNKSKERS